MKKSHKKMVVCRLTVTSVSLLLRAPGGQRTQDVLSPEIFHSLWAATHSFSLSHIYPYMHTPKYKY